MPLSIDLITTYVSQLPPRMREYLIACRGLTPRVIWDRQLGWNGSRITIPIFDRQHHPIFFKLARSPDDSTDFPKMLCWPAGQAAELYGWEHLRKPMPSLVVICEGEFDRLVLESHGIAAVTGTAGANVFLESWAKPLARIPNLFVCYDRDDAGHAGVQRVATLLPQVRVVELPARVGVGGDVTDFFVRHGGTVGEFRRLLAEAKPHPEAGTLADNPRRADQVDARMVANESADPYIAYLKASVPIEVIVETYIPQLRVSGRTLLGQCIFHADTHPSLVVYPDEGRFHCYGCGTHGDVIQFLMEAECWSFPRTIRYLEDYLRLREP